MVGAGRVGQTIARLALAAGRHVTLASSGPTARTRTIADLFAPGADAETPERAAQDADLVVLALPLGAALDELPPAFAAGKVVVDATNYWPETDGERPELDDAAGATSALVQRALPEAVVVKALNHVAYRDLETRAKPAGSAHRIGIGVAGDDPGAVAVVSALVDELGFDPVRAGSLDESWRLGPRSDVFGAVLSADGLRRRIDGRARGG